MVSIQTQVSLRSGLWRSRATAVVLMAATALAVIPHRAEAQGLDRLSVKRYPKIREAERYQLKIAEKYYDAKNWKVAASEYEKFLTLYERSEVAPYCQLKWSLCQVQLRKLNTAIKEGFQSVIDYWPDSPDAVAAAYYIAHTHKNMGNVKQAKQAYQKVLKEHAEHVVAAYAGRDLIDITRIENDEEARLRLWNQLVFDTKPVGRESQRICTQAAEDLATYQFQHVAFEEGVKALATVHKDAQLATHVYQYASPSIRTLVAEQETKEQGEKLVKLAVQWMRKEMPEATSDESKAIAKQYWYHIADFEAAAEHNQQVPKVYDQILQAFGSDDESLKRLGDWYKSIGEFDQARQAYARFDNKIEGQSQVAHSFREEKNYSQSVRVYRQLSQLDAEQPNQWIAQVAYTYRHYEQNYPEAIKVYQELMKVDVDKIDDWLWALADTYHHAGKYTEAIAHYRQCNKHYPETHFRMASCHRALKKYNEAFLLYVQIIGTDQAQGSRAQLEIARTHEQQGAKEKAILAYQKVCKQYPKSGQASTAHSHLQTKYKITVTLGGAKGE